MLNVDDCPWDAAITFHKKHGRTGQINYSQWNSLANTFEIEVEN
jgi:hypothetical protein